MQEKNVDFNSLNIHAWITLDTLEIIDLTLLTTIGFSYEREDYIGLIYYHSAEYIAQTDKRIYHPVIIGTEELIQLFIGSITSS